MRKQVCAGRGSLLSRVAVVSLIGGLAAACSSNTARFSDNPFSNPFNGGSSGEQVSSAPVAAQPAYAPQPHNGGYAPAPVASSQPYQPVASVGGGGWTANGGTPITVGQGDSLTAISNRYGVPANAILSANGLTSPSQVATGRNIVIPVYSVNAPALDTKVAKAPVSTLVPSTTHASAPVRAPLPPVQTASNTLNKAAKAPANTLNNAKQVADAKIGATQKSTQAALQKPVKEPVVVAKADLAQTKAASQKLQQQPMQAASFEPPAAKPVAAAPAQVAAAPKDAEQTASLRSASQSNADFRWPAKGRVISGFGSGGGNEGINIAVPEGTPVRAAESGTVTFAGDDVKSYGNLVLIKHDNGYISAYAHNGALNVKRGDRVSRGQVIAKSGQTGDVTSPQLHFEIRKGQTPVDPVSYLGG